MRGLAETLPVLVCACVIALGASIGALSQAGSTEEIVGCRTWMAPETVGRLDTSYINEASGLAVSGNGSGVLYHINDSGDRGRFFVTAADGGVTGVVDVRGFDPLDTEDLALGRCDHPQGTCLFIADIGDNARRRATTEIVVIPEQPSFPRTVSPWKRIRLRYPDGPRDAESLAVDPEGDLWILTKTADLPALKAAPSILYRLPYERWIGDGDEVHVVERVGEIDFTAISSDPFAGSLPTAMDITPDGRRLLVLTYLNAFEFYLDPSGIPLKPADEMVRDVDYQEIQITPLEQQESVAYLAGGDGFLYTTEGGNPNGVPLVRVACAG